MGARSFFDEADDVVAPGWDFGKPEMSGGVSSGCAEVGRATVSASEGESLPRVCSRSECGESRNYVSGAYTRIMGLTSRFRNACHSCWTKPSLTCHCQMGDNYMMGPVSRCYT